MQHRLRDDHSTRIISPGWFFHPGVKNPQSSVENPEPMFPGESGLFYDPIPCFLVRTAWKFSDPGEFGRRTQVHRSGHHAFLSGMMVFVRASCFFVRHGLFSQNRIKKSSEHHFSLWNPWSCGDNPFGNLPAHPATAARRAAQSSRRHPSLPQRLVIFGAGPHREDGFPCPDKKRGVLNFLVRF